MPGSGMISATAALAPNVGVAPNTKAKSNEKLIVPTASATMVKVPTLTVGSGIAPVGQQGES